MIVSPLAILSAIHTRMMAKLIGGLHAGGMKKTLMNLFSALALSTLVACGGAEADAASSVAGSYKLDKTGMGEAGAAIDITMELKEDGKATSTMTMTVMDKKQEVPASGTWKLEGDQLSITMKGAAGEDQTKTATFKDGSFSVEEEMMGKKVAMKFVKQ